MAKATINDLAIEIAKITELMKGLNDLKESNRDLLRDIKDHMEEEEKGLKAMMTDIAKKADRKDLNEKVGWKTFSLIVTIAILIATALTTHLSGKLDDVDKEIKSFRELISLYDITID